MNENVIWAKFIREHGKWVLKVQVPQWVLADLLTDQQADGHRIPILITLPELGQSMYYGAQYTEGSPHFVTIDHRTTPYLGTFRLEKTEDKKVKGESDAFPLDEYITDEYLGRGTEGKIYRKTKNEDDDDDDVAHQWR